jgi:DNA-binding XRE family transcriptional regulator
MASRAKLAQPPRKSGDYKTLDAFIAEMSPEDQAWVIKRTEALRREVDGLQQLRKIAEKSQKQVADKLGIKQPSVVKMEKQADLYISTLRKYVAAAGGKLTLMVEFPEVGSFEIKGLGDLIIGPEEL